MAKPERFQHYEVQRKPDGTLHELGRGAMGVTYKAFDTNLRIVVALKVISPAFLDSDLVRQRFLREARAAAALRHANVASVFHLGNEGDTWFYAMEFVDGETVDARLQREGPLPVDVSLEIALQVTRALIAADKQKLVHRDLKPANIMLEKEDDGVIAVKVIDFGLAKVVDKESTGEMTLTQGGFLGTPHFASPEQLEEKEIDIRSDIYSLGVTLWCMLTGKVLFLGSMAQVMSKHLYQPVPIERLAGLPVAVVSLLRHMLEKKADSRPQIGELRREIEAALRDLPADISMLPRDLSPALADEDPMATVIDEPGPAPVAPLPPTAAPPPPAPVPSAPVPPAPVPPAPVPPAPVPPAPVPPAPVPPPSPVVSPGVAGPRRLVPRARIFGLLIVLGGGGTYGWFHFRPSNEITSTPPPHKPTLEAVPSPVLPVAPTPVAPAPETPNPDPAPVSDPAPPASKSLATGLAEAQELATSENWAEAMTAFTKLARRFPEEPEPRRQLETICARFISVEMSIDHEVFEKIHVSLEDADALGISGATVLLAEYLRTTDVVRSLDLYEKAALAGNVMAMRQGGLLYSNRKEPGDMARANSWFERGAANGDAACAYFAGESYLLGKGVTRDTAKGLDYLNQAASKDYPPAIDRLGDYYYRETKDYAKALAHFERARLLGWAPSFANLGVLYMNGAGVSPDPKAAAALFRQGAEKGDPSSMFYYAQCLEGGVGLDTDATEARKWYEQAASKGDARATTKLQKEEK